jgi:hypothetical protein
MFRATMHSTLSSNSARDTRNRICAAANQMTQDIHWLLILWGFKQVYILLNNQALIFVSLVHNVLSPKRFVLLARSLRIFSGIFISSRTIPNMRNNKNP